MQKYALISVYDKYDVLALARFLVSRKIKIISTGGTYRYLKENKVPVIEVCEITNFPEMLDGRVKTLHPKIHAGILAIRNNETHIKAINKYKIKLIDYVIVNLYPFLEKVTSDLSFDEKIEFIDIGGPTLLRAAAKNYRDVTVICKKEDYCELIRRIKKNNVTLEFRRNLAAEVFNLMSAYDGLVSRFMSKTEYSQFFTPSLTKVSNLRYGENPHQTACFYRSNLIKGAMGSVVVLNGKPLSYNNYKDVDVA
jgi:phosphoribosylaminoimidazolecarboxamide formyltransferase/IMP cyclohydrolase